MLLFFRENHAVIYLEHANLAIVVGIGQQQRHRHPHGVPRRQRHAPRSAEGHRGARLRLRVVEVERLAHGHRLLHPVPDKDEAEQHGHEQRGDKGNEGARRGEQADGRAPEVRCDHRGKGAQCANENGDGEDEAEDGRGDELPEEGDQPDEPAGRDGKEEERIVDLPGGCASWPAVVEGVRQGVIVLASGSMVW